MKFSDIIKVDKTVKQGTKGWSTLPEIADELGCSQVSAWKKLNAMVKQGRIEQVKMAGSNRALYRIIK